MKFEIKSRIWIKSIKGTFLGEGRVQLLQEIDKCGSISTAATNMGMSYKKAWTLVKSMNMQSKKPLVVKKVGGINGGGSELSISGKKLVKIYNELNQFCIDKINEKFNEYEF